MNLHVVINAQLGHIYLQPSKVKFSPYSGEPYAVPRAVGSTGTESY